MSDSAPTPSRRDLLTGRAVRQQIEHVGDRLADALVDAGEHRPVPIGQDTVRLETSAMACPWAVVMNPGPPRQVMVASDALDLVHVLEDQMTVYRDESDLQTINRDARDRPVTVESGLFGLLRDCRKWSASTEGAFDPTSGPLITLWRDRRLAGTIPTADEIRDVRSRVGIGQVTFDEGARAIRFPQAGFGFDLGAVGKGYAIDRASGHLTQEGVTDFLVHGGHSSLFAAGDHTGQEGWPVGIRNPLFTEQRYATVLLRDAGMSTSGSNIQYFRHQGQRFGHILDPRTGWPAHSPDVVEDGGTPTNQSTSPVALTIKSSANALLSVTVIAPTAAEADALSTAFYVMGLEKARDYCHNRPDIAALLIPVPVSGRVLRPVVCNLPPERLFFAETAGR